MGKILISVLLLASACQAGDTNQPITFHYVKTGDFNNKGYISFGTIFWATNHTTNTFAVSLSAIENRVGSNWVVQYRPMQSLFFQPPGKPMAQLQLGPHAAGYATLQLSSQPTGTIWRAEASIAPVLTGLPDTVARIRRYPEMLRRRIQFANTNIPLNPFATNMTFFGKPTVVFSQEISEE
jgi:hypothetical protein